MALLNTTWTVSYCADHAAAPVEVLNGVDRAAATAEVRRIVQANAVHKVQAEVFSDTGTRIAKHTWIRLDREWVHKTDF